MSTNVVVTGAAHGIGAAIAANFLAHGKTVLLVDINADLLRLTVASLQQQYPDAVAVGFVADLSTLIGIESVVSKCLDLFHDLDCLVNNAADQTVGSVFCTDEVQWSRTMFVNVTCPFLLVKGLIALLEQSKGSVVNIGSLVANQPIPGRVAYDVSKAAIAGLTRALAVDIGHLGIRVNAIAPGHIMTNGADAWRSTYSAEEQLIFPSSYALGRVGHTDEVAKAVVFLASDSATFITGITLPVDGGMSVLCPETAVFNAVKLAKENPTVFASQE